MPRMTRGIFVLSLLPLVACGGDAAPPSDNADTLATTTAEAGADTAGLQALIELPADFGPEGIAIGNGNTFFVGAMTPPNAGQILRGDLSTGEYEQLVPARGVPALGIAYHAGSNRIFVAGGDSGGGAVFDAESGDEVATLDLGGSMINDVEVTDDAAYFTDSEEPALYRVALDANGQPGEITTLELPANFGEAGSCEGVPPLGGNGIAATPDGRYLILIHMSEGQLYRFDTESGEVQQITLTGGDVCSADGLLLDGNTLYAVQNFLNQVAVVELGSDYLTGTITNRITEPFASNPSTKVPTTIADAGEALYAVTAGFADPAPDYVVRVEKAE